MKFKIFVTILLGCIMTLAHAQQDVPELPFESVPDPFIKLPADIHFGEIAGVAVNSHGHVFVFLSRRQCKGPRLHGNCRSVVGVRRTGQFCT